MYGQDLPRTDPACGGGEGFTLKGTGGEVFLDASEIGIPQS